MVAIDPHVPVGPQLRGPPRIVGKGQPALVQAEASLGLEFVNHPAERKWRGQAEVVIGVEIIHIQPFELENANHLRRAASRNRCWWRSTGHVRPRAPVNVTLPSARTNRPSRRSRR